MGSGDAFRQHKAPTPVRVEITGARPVEGYVFLATGDSLLDLLNDAHPFIPVRRADGATVIVAKQHIVSIVERAAKARNRAGQRKTSEQNATDKNSPYAVLRVAPNASMAEINAACKRLTKTLIKKRTASGGNDAQVNSALMAAKKILNAYKLILSERGLDKPESAKRAAPARARTKSRA